MASATPVIASDVGGLKFSVADGETGFLVPPKDEAAFAKAIDRVLQNQMWRERMSEAARRRVETHFSWDGVAQQLDELYVGQIDSLTQAFFSNNAVSQFRSPIGSAKPSQNLKAAMGTSKR